ncbi:MULTISPECIES: hypothetical protein [Paenibacillus]|uniref:Uncharacterized protein n=1 Tax=Paenibacillus xylanilyticus TaxID=248903 RepID=A0A7Y6EW19_9BACL|nr:hypothetical protein [Paenibacillus xylanilyticus]NUU77336.1 hypothetical protein [Paenibacillus xylanilyticus]
MNSVKGTNRLILDDMGWYLKIFSFITLMLTVVYLAIGFIFDVAYSTQLLGPMYGGICAFAVAGIITLYPVAIGLGSTRIQFLKSFYVISAWMVVGAMVILNVIYLIMHLLQAYGSLGVTFYQLGTLYSKEYHFISYLWIDLMTGFLVLGLSIFSTVCWIRLGMRNFLILFFGLTLILTLAIVLSDLSVWVQWFTSVNWLALFTVTGVIGWALILSTYPMMKNAPLTMKGRKD